MSLLKVNYDVLDLIIAQTVQCSHNANDIRQLLTLMGVCKSLRNFVLQRHRLWRSLSNFPLNMDQVRTMQLFKKLPAFTSTVHEIRFGESNNCKVWEYIVFFILRHCKNLEVLDISGCDLRSEIILYYLEILCRVSNPGDLKLKNFAFKCLQSAPNWTGGDYQFNRHVPYIQETLDIMSGSKVHLTISGDNKRDNKWDRRTRRSLGFHKYSLWEITSCPPCIDFVRSGEIPPEERCKECKKRYARYLAFNPNGRYHLRELHSEIERKWNIERKLRIEWRSWSDSSKAISSDSFPPPFPFQLCCEECEHQ